MHEECIAESEDGADIVVLGYAVQHDRDRSALPGRKVVTGGFASAQLYRPTFLAAKFVGCHLKRVNGITSNAFYRARVTLRASD
jgi:hypothetical protein